MRSLLRKGLAALGVTALVAIPLGLYPRFFGRKRLRFTSESRQTIRVAREIVGQDLDGDVAIELRVTGPIDLAHATCAQ